MHFAFTLQVIDPYLVFLQLFSSPVTLVLLSISTTALPLPQHLSFLLTFILLSLLFYCLHSLIILSFVVVSFDCFKAVFQLTDLTEIQFHHQYSCFLAYPFAFLLILDFLLSFFIITVEDFTKSFLMGLLLLLELLILYWLKDFALNFMVKGLLFRQKG